MTVELPPSLIEDSINQLFVTLVDNSISNQQINALSLIVSLELLDGSGYYYNSFDDPIEICFSVPSGDTNGQECLAYYDEAKGEWICEDACVKVKNGLVCGTTDHFTNFAILLDGGGSNDDCGGDDIDVVISWLSLAVIITAIIIFFIAIITIELHARKKASQRFKKAGGIKKLSRQDILSANSQKE